MYQYFRGYVIREGNDGISSEKLRSLYRQAGWVSDSLPAWQNEKFEIALRSSAWAFTVWLNDDLVGLVRVVSDKVMVASIQDLMVISEHGRKGIGEKLISLCLQKLPHGSWSAQTTPENYEFYQKCGFEMMDSDKGATLIYNGFGIARRDGHR